MSRLPNFVIIGAGKAGTTSLHYYLDQHPEISMSWPKETNFFTREDYMDALDWYMSCFPDRPGLRGEASPHYSNYPRRPHVPERMFALVPEVKLIYLVRDPLQRTESHYYHRYFNRTESRPIDQAFAEVAPDDAYITASKYGMQLEQYLKFFGLSQMLIVDSRDLKQAREATMATVCSFLGVQPVLAKHLNREIKVRTRSVRTSRTAEHVRRSPPAEIGRRMLPVRVREPLFATAKRVLSPAGRVTQVAPSPEARERVAGFFRDDAALLRELTGQPFAHWSV